MISGFQFLLEINGLKVMEARVSQVYFHVMSLTFKPRCWEPPAHYLCTPEPGRLDFVISIQKRVKSDAYPVAICQKVTNNLPVSFYSPTPGFNFDVVYIRLKQMSGGLLNHSMETFTLVNIK